MKNALKTDKTEAAGLGLCPAKLARMKYTHPERGKRDEYEDKSSQARAAETI
jgi:hypothetical protein